MQLAVLEYLCGGGLANATNHATDRDELQSLFQEGFGMLRHLTEDLVACGHSVVTVVDPQAMDDCELLSLRSLASVHLLDSKEMGADGFLSHWIRVASNADRTLVIAPEIDGELSRITQVMLESNVEIWGATQTFLQHGCDKLTLATPLPEQSGYPKTWSATQWHAVAIQYEESLGAFHRDGWVLKDRFGAGCADIRWFPNTATLKQFLESSEGIFAREPLGERNREHWIIQPWIPGTPASLSCIASPDAGLKLVGCLGQSIERTEGVRYLGGYGPLWGEHREFLEEWVRQTISPFSGVCGWFGLDVVISPPQIPHENSLVRPLDIRLIEINPRLTTSYVGWRDLIGPALAEGVLGISDAWASCRNIEKQVIFRVPSLP